MKHFLQQILLLTIIAVISIVLGWADFSEQAGLAHAARNEIILARGVDADNLDPQKTSNTQSLQITNLIFDTLLTMDENGGLHPGLAESWAVSKDGKEYRFTIRSDIKFHDGTRLDANAVKFNIDRAVDPATNNPSASLWGPIESASVEGKDVIVKFATSYGPFPVVISSLFSSIIAPSSVSGSEFKPIGSGPYKFVEWVRNDHITLVSNPDYKNFNPMVANPGEPHIKNLRIQVIPEAVARMAALKTGEVTFVEPSLEEAADLSKDSKFKVHAATRSGQQVFAAFTWQIPPLDNVLVRQAVGYALDRTMYAEIGFEGLVEPASCPMAPGLFASDQKQCLEWGQSYDPEQAKKLLAQAGYGPDKPIDVVLSVHKLPGWDRMHQIMQQHLKAVGINAKIETREVAAFFDHMGGENKRTDGLPVIWTMGMSGVDSDYLYFLWHQPGFCNMGLNAEMDKMLEEQRTLIGDQRKRKLEDISKYLLTKAYAIPLVSPGWNWLIASQANVEGFKIGYVSALILNDVRFK